MCINCADVVWSFCCTWYLLGSPIWACRTDFTRGLTFSDHLSMRREGDGGRWSMAGMWTTSSMAKWQHFCNVGVFLWLCLLEFTRTRSMIYMYKKHSSPPSPLPWHRALQNSLATLWYHRGLTTNGWEILIWHMSPVFCKYAEYFPPTVSENSCLLSQCRHRDKFFKVSPPRRESRKYFQTWSIL